MTKKEILFSLTEKNFEWSYTKGSGKGGQKRNKTSNAVHCKHVPSGSYGYSEATRSKHDNKIDAFTKCVGTDKFKAWLNMEIARATGQLEVAKSEAEKQMQFIKVEVKDEKGRWIDEKERNDTII